MFEGFLYFTEVLNHRITELTGLEGTSGDQREEQDSLEKEKGC